VHEESSNIAAPAQMIVFFMWYLVISLVQSSKDSNKNGVYLRNIRYLANKAFTFEIYDLVAA
jgi:hypothetical protein